VRKLPVDRCKTYSSFEIQIVRVIRGSAPGLLAVRLGHGASRRDHAKKRGADENRSAFTSVEWGGSIWGSVEGSARAGVAAGWLELGVDRATTIPTAS
jgi:hypothetical protein